VPAIRQIIMRWKYFQFSRAGDDRSVDEGTRNYMVLDMARWSWIDALLTIAGTVFLFFAFLVEWK
jgi:hypothetical protein